MAHTNRGRVILGGLLAGLVINVVEFITNGVVLREAWGKAMQALGKPAELSTGAIAIFNVWGFLLASLLSGSMQSSDRATVPDQRPQSALD